MSVPRVFKTAIASLLALAPLPSWAGFLQIDPTGTGTIAGSVLLTDPAPTNGNLLMQDAVPDNFLVQSDGTVFAQTSLGLTSFGIPGSELSFLFELDVASHLFGAPGPGQRLTMNAILPGSLRIFFDPTADADSATGTGYGISGGAIEIATGDLRLAPGSTLLFTQAPAPDQPLAFNMPTTSSIAGVGSGLFAVDITFVNSMYVLNDIGSMVDDLFINVALHTPFAPFTNASRSFDEGNVIPDFGNGVNDFNCGATLTMCDFQAQMDANFTFVDRTSVPAPGTLLLLGLGLAGIGFSVRRR